ncbi:MAG: NYN domain-containing protein [Longimicrobiaceae bacterium]
MATNVVVLIDGGHLRAVAKSAKQPYNARLVDRVARAVVDAPDEQLFRALYYDCDPFIGTVKQPISGTLHRFNQTSSLLSDIEQLELFAVRRGVLKFRGWERTEQSMGKPANALTDADFEPRWEQKGVDLRLGLDMLGLTETRVAPLVVALTGDTDLIPALKLCRGRGLQVAGVDLPGRRIGKELRAHLDFFRSAAL